MNHDQLEEFRQQWRRDLESGPGHTDLEDTSLAASKLEDIRHSSDLSNDSVTPQTSQAAVSTAESTQLEEQLVQHSAPSRTTPKVFFQDIEHKSSEEHSDLSALQVYEVGVEKERQGLLSDALINYRRAFKLDPDVDKLFREAFRSGHVKEAQYDKAGSSVEETNYAKFVQVANDYDPSIKDGAFDQLQDMTAMMAALRMPIESTNPDESRQGITKMPEEILQQILSCAMVEESAACLLSLSLTCQKFFLLLHDMYIWRQLCYNTYHDQVYTAGGIQLGSNSAFSGYLEKLHTESHELYSDDWKRMFIEKPRIRYNGLYISTCHYTRPGVREESLDWTSPIHLVTYFRFLRFFPNGHCLSLLTPAQPKEVVHSIVPGTKLKGVQQGTWSMTTAGGVSIKANGPSNYVFFMELQLKSSARGRQNKLAWSRFFGVHPISAEITQFNLKNDRSHYFHKVNSYEKH